MIYAALMTVGILESIFALLLALEFFDMVAEKEAEYQDGYADGYVDGKSDQIALELNWNDAEYYDALVDEANCWFGMDSDALRRKDGRGGRVMDRCLSENGILEAMDTWPKYGCMPDGRFIRLTKENEKDYVPYVHYDDMVKAVKGIPSLDVAPVIHAHWIETEDLAGNHYIECSHCHWDFWLEGENAKQAELFHCPRCGAKMDDGVET